MADAVAVLVQVLYIIPGVVLQAIICSVLCTAIGNNMAGAVCCTWCCIAGYNLFCTLYSYKKTIWLLLVLYMVLY
jgi:uncharacterized protein (DUF2062 family)